MTEIKTKQWILLGIVIVVLATFLVLVFTGVLFPPEKTTQEKSENCVQQIYRYFNLSNNPEAEDGLIYLAEITVDNKRIPTTEEFDNVSVVARNAYLAWAGCINEARNITNG